MSADAMLAALLGSKHKVSMDLRANLKQVKKELKEEVGALFYQTTWSQTSNRLKKIDFCFWLYECAFCFFRRSKQETGGRTLKTRLAWTAGRRCLRQRLYRFTGPVISLSTESIWKSAQEGRNMDCGVLLCSLYRPFDECAVTEHMHTAMDK